MKILDIITAKSAEKGIAYLIAGGHAVGAYVLGRQTGDIDLVVAAKERNDWRELILGLRYTLYFEHQAFIQFRPPDLGYWPLDLIVVEDATFVRMQADSRAVDYGGTSPYATVSPKHLIAMKCHAAKQTDREDPTKDIRDIIELAKHEGIDLRSPDFAAYCLKYGNEELLRKIHSLV